MDAALRMNLSDALADKLDQQILNGDEGSVERHEPGEPQRHDGDHLRPVLVAVWLWPSGRQVRRFHRGPAPCHGHGDLRARGTTYRHQNADDLALARLVAITGGVKVSAHVPAAAANKQNAVIRLGMRRDMVAPIWEGVTLIPDEVTKAANGQIVLTAVMLHAVKILRSDGFLQATVAACLIMPSILLSGPAGANKSALARRLLAESSELAAIADFQLVYRALDRRRARPLTAAIRSAMIACYRLTEYVRRAIITGAVDRDIDVIATNSDGDPARRSFLLGQLGKGATERIVDPGEDIVAARLSDPETGVLSPECKSAVGRWYWEEMT